MFLMSVCQGRTTTVLIYLCFIRLQNELINEANAGHIFLRSNSVSSVPKAGFSGMAARGWAEL